MTTIVYTAVQLKEWHSELPRKSSLINEHLSLNQYRTERLSPLQSKLESIGSEISSVRTQITLAEVGNAIDASYHQKSRNGHGHGHDHHHNHGHHKHSGTDFLHGVGHALAVVNTASLYSELRHLNAQKEPIEDAIKLIRREMSSSNSIIEDAKNRVQWLTEQINLGTQFLDTLKNNPAELLNTLKKRIADCFKAYDDDHPINRSLQVRICLFSIEEKLASFLSDPNQISPKNLQINYLRLCALIEDMHRKVSNENQDKEFAHILEVLIDHTHIASGGDLPDDMCTGYSITQHLVQLQSENRKLFAMSEQEFALLEQDIYAEKIKDIRGRLVYDTILQAKINSAVSLIDSEVQNKLVKTEPVDYHFYNRIIQDLHYLSIHSQDKNCAKHLGKLAELSSGAPSTSKKVLGALAAVVGVLLITASIAFLITTACGSSFLSAALVGTGLSLIESQVAVGASLSVTAAASGGLTFWGCSKFKEGERQGISKELVDVQEELDNPTILPFYN